MRLLSVLSILSSLSLHAQWGFEGDTTPTWTQVIARYTELDRMHSGARLLEIGQDDGGQPMHLFVIADGSGFTPDSIRAAGKNILWITNGIHPGEPDGIDACLRLSQALLESDQLMGLTVNTAVCIVPVYNISGAENRGSYSRVNQNGPKAYGFRGNARNLDLNRDFMKQDSENARSLVRALAEWDPDLYFETHVSDGADHRYIMALMTSQKDKLDAALRTYLTGTLVPGMYAWMDRKGHAMCPYFETYGASPEDGLTGFYDSPRYSSGHSALFGRIGIISESHVLKPYAERVNATLQLLFGTLAVMNEHPTALREARAEAKRSIRSADTFGLNWAVDTSVVEQLPWKGYAARRRTSAVTGLSRLHYDHQQPLDTLVPWRDTYRPKVMERKPKGYVIPRQWDQVRQCLLRNGVEVEPITQAREVWVEQDSIAGFTTVNLPYEGHYLHREISATRKRLRVMLRSGDWYVPMGHSTDRFVMEALECRAEDGFFAWNFFDAILQQKEWFNDYVFEDLAAEMLEKDPALKAAFEAERKRDPGFAKDAWAQLTWIYRRSPWMEPTFRKYPVLRVVE
ncbi:MAG TPA: M14 family zinc carboxypeptidase [Flavobacteriales bacterium]